MLLYKCTDSKSKKRVQNSAISRSTIEHPHNQLIIVIDMKRSI